ncbi:hypothetical protein [Marinobacterium litorale]|uniref:hypothetical protein n=1 Tax=Marinobacterium litorale TaxID=404770 RepID=UPI000A011A17|nr:hypothetical protein [Marinobacterium litorale]
MNQAVSPPALYLEPVRIKQPSKQRTGDFKTRIAGIPCQISVTHYLREPGKDTWDSDWDHTGYVEFEFEILDQRNRPAPWLSRKLTEVDHHRLLTEYEQYLSSIHA